MTLRVGELQDADRSGAASLLGRAFAESPMNVAVIGGDTPRRERCNRAGVEAYLPAAMERGGVAGAWYGGGLAGVIVGMPPHAFPLPPPPR